MRSLGGVDGCYFTNTLPLPPTHIVRTVISRMTTRVSEEDDLDAELAQFLSECAAGSNDGTSSSSSTSTTEQAPLPRIITYAQCIHCPYINKKGKEKRRPPTIVTNHGAAHPLAATIAQLVACFCSNTLTTLTNITHGFCAQVRVGYHEPHTTYESCCKMDDCVHMSVSIHRNPLGGKFCKCMDGHEVVPVAEFSPEQAQEYRVVMNRIRELLNPTNTTPMRGQLAPLAPPKPISRP